MAGSGRDWDALERATLFVSLFGWIMLISDAAARKFGYKIDNIEVVGAALGVGFFGLSLVRSVWAPASRECLWEADRSLRAAYIRLIAGIAMLLAVTALGCYYAYKRWPY